MLKVVIKIKILFKITAAGHPGIRAAGLPCVAQGAGQRSLRSRETGGAGVPGSQAAGLPEKK